MRPWTEKVYGVPPEQVVGSSGELKFEMRNGQPVLVKLPAIDFIDDKAGIPQAIQYLARCEKCQLSVEHAFKGSRK